ncbi:MAG: hypothetical protein AB1530_04155 [Candidatus Omnitrophota bacterium]
MTREEMRGVLISLLKRLTKEKKSITLDEIYHHFKELKKNKSIQFDKNLLDEEIHLLLINNILMRSEAWGMQPNWNHYALTEYGKECIEQDCIIALDPEGYLQQIKRSIQDIDPVIFEYLSESIASFNKRLNLASTITLGVASEQAILLLIDSFCLFIEGSCLKTYIDKLNNEKFIRSKYSIFIEALKKLPTEVKRALPNNYEIIIDSIFNCIKMNRDDTGHPKGGGKDRSLQGANLQAFRSYLVIIYQLIKYFGTAKLREIDT